MPTYKGSTNQGLIYYGSPNTNCLTSVPKNVKLELTYGAWTQPIFSSNTNGGLTLSASHESGPAWYAFNGDKTTNDNCWWTNHGVTSTSNPCWIQLKSTIKLKLNQVVIRNEHNTPENFKTAYLQVSNDGSSWTNVVTISGTNTGGYETTVNFTVSDGYYYYRLYFTESYSSGGVSIQTITFSGIAQNILTLKAGSKVYVPNGFEEDGTTPKFDEVVIESDYSSGTSTPHTSGMILPILSGNKVVGFEIYPFRLINSGSTDTGSSTHIWYDTSANIIKIYNNGTLIRTDGLPISTFIGDGNYFTSIDQIFDWCGFIGSTAFVLPGVKGLIPNGFNADGTYKSIEFTTDRVLTTTRTWDITASFIQKLFFYNRGTGLGIQSRQIESESMPTPNDWTVWYNPKENIQRWNISSNTLTDISQWTVDTTMRYIGEIPSDGTSKITSLTPTTVQPLSTGITISNVYKGSTLVYHLGFDTVTFTENGTWTVPAGIKQIRVDCVAGQGLTFNETAVGGLGGRVQCVLSVTSGQLLYIKVGKQYTTYTDNRNDSIVYINNDELQALIHAGGGGSAANPTWLRYKVAKGGAGGGLTGGVGTADAPTSNILAQGGSQSAGGDGSYFNYPDVKGIDGRSTGKGKRLYGGNAVPDSGQYRCGCGGAGYYGGGGGLDAYHLRGHQLETWAMGGGGGSSYTHPTLCSEVVHTQGFQSGNGYITISMV